MNTSPERAIGLFWAGFGYPAYEENSVPFGGSKPEFPYITYQVVEDSMGRTTSCTAFIWDEKRPGMGGTPPHHATAANDKKATEIRQALTPGKRIKCDGGYLWITRGHPFAQNMGDQENPNIRRKLLNVTIDFIIN